MKLKRPNGESLKSYLSKLKNVHLIENDVLGVVKALKAYDPTYFVIYHSFNKRYEVHNIEQPGYTYAMSLPDGKLDKRLVERVILTDVKRRGRLVFDDIKKQQAQLQREKEKTEANHIEAIAKYYGPSLVEAMNYE